MDRNSKNLFQINNLDLRLDVVLVDFVYPVLFTCVDDYGNMYIASCYLADSKTKGWLIADTSPEKVISLLQDEITIRDIFLDTPLWQAVLKVGDNAPAVKQVNADELDPYILPAEGEFMDVDPGEFAIEHCKGSDKVGV